jgi:general secretion pathway protein C
VLGVVVALAVGWQSGRLIWQLVPSAPAAQPPSARTATADTARGDGGDGSNRSAEVASLSLFGAAPEPGADEGASDAAAAANAPETRLNLSLKGVYAPGEGQGLAIITSGGGDESVYAAGDEIAGNARIQAIYSGGVVLQRDGRAETLRMAGAQPLDGSATADSGGRGDTSAEQRRIAERASELRRRLVDNPGELARMVRFQPHVENGALVGYKIQPRQADAELLGELGLRPSDIVTQVNGRSLDDPREANKVLQDLRDARRIEISFIREGQQRSLSVPLGQAGG